MFCKSVAEVRRSFALLALVLRIPRARPGKELGAESAQASGQQTTTKLEKEMHGTMKETHKVRHRASCDL